MGNAHGSDHQKNLFDPEGVEGRGKHLRPFQGRVELVAEFRGRCTRLLTLSPSGTLPSFVPGGNADQIAVAVYYGTGFCVERPLCTFAGSDFCDGGSDFGAGADFCVGSERSGGGSDFLTGSERCGGGS